MMELLGESISDSQIQEMVKFADRDMDGAIGFGEFCEAMK